ncbi:MAG: DUF4301 family protein [Bacteroidales bacterium]|nr:DUF4301 family protein [Bacteroidales bacterium]
MNNSEKQLERFKKGFPWLDVVAPAVPGKGIEVMNEQEIAEAEDYLEKAEIKGKCKFVPASGAASRMFKDIYAGLENPNDSVRKLCENIEKFAFYDPKVFDGKENVAELLLSDKGLGYGTKPKGVLKFHRYGTETRTAFAEHLVEGQEYMRNDDGSVRIIVTISPEHRSLFENALSEIKEKYEKKYGVKYDIEFTYQDKNTDTIAVTADNKPFIKDDGEILRRPAGHGALIYNLNEVKEELVSIKNIDNVCVERMLPVTAKYKKALMGRALQLRDRIFGYIYALDQIAAVEITNPLSSVLQAYQAVQEDVYATDEVQSLCNEIEAFLKDELCIEMPEAKDCKSRALALREKLDRPVRVCGMVRNLGEPGGGPYIVKGKDGSTSLQILESVQINQNDPKAAEAMSKATHFNPVDLICCIRDHKGDKFNLLEYVDEDTGFISSKSYQGRELKALELPGLWNGSMSDWNTLFVEVPVETFNPVKVVLDLLRPAHQ